MKKLQGLIWNEAYTKGEVKGHHCLCRFMSIPQDQCLHRKLLFGNSVVGDVTKNLSGYFDTNIGLKGESKSYEKICKQISANPSDLLFLTDVEAEARAASDAGVQAILVVRDGNTPLSVEAKQDFPVIHSLEEIA
ncbi:hypothetical protein KIN20_004692 [Parelaphostrongylus tenuis]|uniref:Enolase-phosphatase E1 n=1 Tax=Parelaphostrongylus tenuis TaxID=148309 RepID=A0AAD5MKB1_PARTN|nr:hypothetical protein KIN20_004692 [Parelaphostrongylus tenuis]